MRRVLDIAKKVLSIVIVVVAVVVMIFTIISVTMFDRNDRNIFGYKAFIVLSDSMKATDFAAGDVVIVKNVDPTTLKEGDIITFSSQNADTYGEVITHKIRTLTRDASGERGFVTYGTTTGVDDETIVTYPYISGKYMFSIPKLGMFFMFLKTTPGFIVCILIPFLLLVGMQALNTVRLFVKYKKEQLAAIKKQQDKLDAERKQSEELMQELLMLTIKSLLDAFV